MGENVNAVECTLDLGELSLLLSKVGLRSSRCRPSVLERGLDPLQVSRHMIEDVCEGGSRRRQPVRWRPDGWSPSGTRR